MSNGIAGRVWKALGALGLGAALLVCLSGCPQQTAKGKITINGETREVDLGKDVKEDIADDFLGKRKPTDPNQTLKMQEVQLPPKTTGGVWPLVKRKNLLLLVKMPSLFPDPVTKRPSDDVVFTRHDLSGGKVVSSFTLKRDFSSRDIVDVSPDGGLVAIKNFDIGLNVAVFSLVDGKEIVKSFKPSYLRADAPTRKTRVGACALRFLSATRWLVGYDDGAIDVWTNEGSSWKRKPIRASLPTIKPGFPGAKPAYWCVSNNGKTVAYWNGKGFDLINTESGESSGQTGALELRGDEKNVTVMKSRFAPDGSRVLASVSVFRGRRGETINACFSVAGKEAPTHLPAGDITMGQWWGSKHILKSDDKMFSTRMHVVDVTTGKAVAEFKTAGGTLLRGSTDGKVRVLTHPNGNEPVHLLWARFPRKLLPAMEQGASGDKLPLLQASKDGLGIRPPS